MSTHGSISPIKLALARIEYLEAENDRLRQHGHGEPIAVVALGCRFPGGANSPDLFWKMLAGGVDAVSEVPRARWNIDEYYDPDPLVPGKIYTRFGAFLDQVDLFDPEFFGISPREAARMDPQQRILLEVAWEALERCGFAGESRDAAKLGVFVGSMWNEYTQASLNSADQIDAYVGTGSAGSFLAGRLAYHFGARGPSVHVDGACSSSLLAVHLAVQSLRKGECNWALAGGVNLMLSPEPSILNCKLRALSPDGRCKTFDALADGYGRGEGCGVVTLRRLSDALRDREPVLALIRGSAINHNGSGNGLTVPNPSAQKDVIRAALSDAGTDPAQVSYVEAHGTGTPLGDPIELRALCEVLGNGRNEKLTVGCVKTNIGHLEGAAGIAGLIKVVLSLVHREIPPHLHLSQLNPKIAVEPMDIRIPRELTPWRMPAGGTRMAGVSSFGISGTNAHVILEGAPAMEKAGNPAPEREWHVLALSAREEPALRELAERYLEWLGAHPDAALADVAYTAAVGRSHMEERAAVVARSVPEARQLLSKLVAGESASGLYRKGEGGEPSTPAEELASRYVSGATVDFAGWDRAYQRSKLALPTYPFQRRRYWMDPPRRKGWGEDGRKAHPLLGMRKALGTGEVIYSQPVGCAYQGWLADHQVFGKIVAPGAFYLAAALASETGPVRLSEGVFARPLVLNDGEESREMQVVIQPGEGARKFAIYSQGAGEEHWTLHVEGKLEGGTAVPAAEEMEDLRNRLKEEPVEGYYEAFVSVGIELGEAFQGLARLWVGEGEAVGEVRRPAGLEGVGGPIHPAVLDACLQVVGAARGKDWREAYVPFQWGEVEWWESVGERFYCAARLREGAAGETLEADLWVTDEGGRAIGRIQGYVARRVSRESLLGGVGSEIDSWLYEVAWREQEREREGEWPSPESVARQVREEAAGLIAEAGLEEEIAGRLDEEMEAVSRAYAREALESVAPENVAAAQRRLYRRLGQIASKGMEPASEGLQRLKERYPQARLEATLLERCGQRLPEVLRGECDPLGLLFPTQGASAEQVYRDAPGARLLNRMVERTLAAVVAQAGEQRKIRVLEVGAGTGATTLAALRALPRERTEYTYTDISAGFFDAAQRRLGEYPEVRYRVLDIERGVEEQGFERGQYDVVIAAHVLHATRDLGASVRHARELLAEGGLLIVVEGLRAQSWLDVTFGQLEGWWRFADQWREQGPLVGVDRWREVLGEAGIGGVEAMVPWGESPQGVLVGRAEGPGNKERGWWLIAGGGEVGERAAERLREKGWECEVAAGRGAEGESAEYWEERLKRGAPSGVAHLCSLDGGGELEEDLRHSGASLLGLVQAMVRREAAPRNGLWVVTEGGQGVEGEGCRSLAQSGVWGMGKVIALEHPELGCRRVDLERGRAREQIAAAVEEWGTAGSEDHIAWRGARRLVARLQRVEKGSHLAIPEGENYSLRKAENGTLEGLRWEPLTCPAPGRGEVQVEVRAAGLNFRDVLNALGMYPGEGGPLGGEMAGRVVEVGPGVDQYAVGDAVMGLVPGAFAGRVNVRVALLAHKPEQVSFSAAAGVPIAFATAALGLERAGLRAGERILIHAAAGGVGLAAIQLARAVGAEIHATASADKQDYLRGLGIEHIYDSRSVEFGERILADTGNRGVDVVLNSLTGEGYVEASLGALGRGGRFVEISKREIWSEREMAGRRPDVRYEVLALDEEMEREPERIGAVVREVVARMGRGELHALPGEGYGMSEARAAFRRMQQARHVGKLVLMAPGYRGKLDGAAGYLITGGLGGLGLEVARWAVERGARYVALNGRRGPEGRAEAAIEQLRAQGAEVEIVLGDVSREADVEAMLRRARGSGRRLAGVFHLAGVLRDGALVNQEWGRFEEVLGPKARGAWHLHRHTAGDDPELFVMFSSTASLLGNRGQANHAAANMFLDMLAQYRRSQGMSGVSINWGAWSKVGAAARLEEALQAQMSRKGIGWISPELGLQALERALRSGSRQVGIMPIERNFLRDSAQPVFLSEAFTAEPARAKAAPQTDWLHRIGTLPSGERFDALTTYLRQEVSEVLQLAKPPSIDAGFLDLGMDSLMAVEFRNRLNRGLGLEPPLPATALFDHPNIRSLAHRLLEFAQSTPTHRGPEAARSNEVAVVGLSCRFPGAPDTSKFWDLLAAGREATQLIPADRWNRDSYYDPDPDAPGKMYTKVCAFLDRVDLFDAAFFSVSPREAMSLDPQQRLLLELSWEALENAGLQPDGLKHTHTGVYLGLSSNDYADLLKSHSHESIDAYLATGTAHSTAAGRISYLFGFEGPSIAVDTACSSSLVAVHQACRDLIAGECDLALSGGVNVILCPENLINFSRARMLAPDGRCKTFDASADGFVRGEGCGLVVLKRLADAQRDGDRIVAVIRGSAINQDGRSAGLTAPNGPAQQRVMEAALQRAGVEPHEVAYLEAHGTGTALGDPIEVQAAAAVLGKGRDGDRPLLMGSVKTNIGHLEAAAGVAGLIKVILSMEHGRIPRHLHFDRPNPHIAWEQLPVEVTREARAWPEGKKIAGVSSFGFSGTNAHVVVEEGPQAEEGEVEKEQRTHVLALSARDETALRALAERYVAWLGEHPEASLADVAYTAGVGRAHFETRAAVIASTVEEARERLSQLVRGERAMGVFGSGENPAAAAYVAGETPDFAAWDWGGKRRKLALPSYPFQRRRYWLDARESVREAILGTRQELGSGEVVYSGNAGCPDQVWLADHRVFDVVLAPGALFLSLALASQPAPVCLSEGLFARPLVPGNEAERRPLQLVIHPGAQGEGRLAIYSQDSGEKTWTTHLECCVQPVTNESRPATETLEQLQERLDEQDPSTFYGRFAAAGIELGPAFRGLSKLWTGNEEALGEVRKPTGVTGLAGPIHPVVLDACLQVAGAAFGSELREPYVPFQWERLELWESAPDRLYCHARLREGVREETLSADLWLLDAAGRPIGSITGYVAKRVSPQSLLGDDGDQIENWLYEVVWREQKRTRPDAAYEGWWLIAGDGGGVGARAAKRLRELGLDCVIAPANGAEAERAEYWDQWLKGSAPAGVAHLCSLGSRGELRHELRHSGATLLGLVQALVKRDLAPRNGLWVVTEGGQAVEGEGCASLAQSAVWGMGKVIALEHPEVGCRRVDLERGRATEQISAAVEEWVAPECEDQIAWRGTRRLVARLRRVEKDSEKHSLRLNGDKTYLITGGLGGLGLEVAQWAVERGARYVALNGLRAPNDKAVGVIERLRQQGAEVEVALGDVSRESDVVEILARVRSSGRRLGGVFHLAGVLRDAALMDQDWAGFDEVLGPKAMGAWHLHKHTAADGPELFVMFSSTASVFANRGQVNHAAANMFLDMLAEHRHAEGLSGTSINWGAWSTVGAAAERQRDLEPLAAQAGVRWISPNAGLQALERILGTGRSRATVLPVNWNLFQKRRGSQTVPPLLSEFVDRVPSEGHTNGNLAAAWKHRLHSAAPGERRTLLAEYLEEQVQRVLQLDSPPNPMTGFSDLGMDSLMAVQLRRRLAADLARGELSSTVFFDHPNITELVRFLLTPAGVSTEPDWCEESPPARLLDDISLLPDAELIALLDQALEVPRP